MGYYSKLIVFLLSQLFVVSSSKQIYTKHDDLVETTALQGSLIGAVTPEAGIFWGIPFSQPPVGKYRWRKPRDPIKFEKNYLNATYTRPGCPQTCIFKAIKKYRCVLKTSEDCLHLNVWVPRRILTKSSTRGITGNYHYVISDDVKNTSSKSLAVMVFIHGGNFVHDSASQVIYDGRYLAQRGDVIIVNIEYRLGPLGFLVQGKGSDAARGNYGMWDIIKGLEWVKKNIKYFGGNPDMVTAFGQSAGAESLSILLTSSHGNGLFHQAIFESDPLAVPFRSMSSAKKYGARFARKVGCKAGDMRCLRKTNVRKIVEKSPGTPFSLFARESILQQGQQWGPVKDHDLLHENPIVAFQKGQFRKIPVIMGGNSADGYQYAKLLFSKFKISQFLYQLAMDILLKNKANTLLSLYPANCCDNTKEVTEIITDFVFLCPTRSAMFRMFENSWFYVFNGSIPFKSLWAFRGCMTRACHGEELGFVFNPVNLTNFHQTRQQYSLARRMQYYWANFAKYGNPNGRSKGGSHLQQDSKTAKQFNIKYWEKFQDPNIRDYNAIKFSEGDDVIVKNILKQKCNFWDSANLYGRL